jgi:hypothetical protein
MYYTAQARRQVYIACVREVVASAAQRREGGSFSGSVNWNFL